MRVTRVTSKAVKSKAVESKALKSKALKSKAVVSKAVNLKAKLLLCPYCDYTTQKRSDLNRHHWGRHSPPELRPFPCVKCGHRFATKCGLNVHMNTHTGATPYKCKIVECGMEFSDPSSQSRHGREIHGDGKFYCLACPQGLTRKEAWAKHVWKQHGIDPKPLIEGLERTLEPIVSPLEPVIPLAVVRTTAQVRRKPNTMTVPSSDLLASFESDSEGVSQSELSTAFLSTPSRGLHGRVPSRTPRNRYDPYGSRPTKGRHFDDSSDAHYRTHDPHGVSSRDASIHSASPPSSGLHGGLVPPECLPTTEPKRALDVTGLSFTFPETTSGGENVFLGALDDSGDMNTNFPQALQPEMPKITFASEDNTLDVQWPNVSPFMFHASSSAVSSSSSSPMSRSSATLSPISFPEVSSSAVPYSTKLLMEWSRPIYRGGVVAC